MRLRASEKIINELEALGYTNIHLWQQQGVYRHKTWDLAKWGANVKNAQGLDECLSSWNTMTECARHGFTVERQIGGFWDNMLFIEPKYTKAEEARCQH